MNKMTARLAGILYLLVIIFGVFSEFAVRSKLIVPDDISVTVKNILQNSLLFRLGIVSDLIMQTLFLILGFTLYRLLQNVQKEWAVFMLLCVGTSVAIMCVNMLNNISPLLLLKTAEIGDEFANKQIHFCLGLHEQGYRIAQIFFGLWLLPLGMLVIKSGCFPKILGWLLIFSCCSFLIDIFAFFLYQDYYKSITDYITFPTVIGEFAFCLYLVIVGIRENKS